MGKRISGNGHTCPHTGSLSALALLLAQCGRFGFETLPLPEDPPFPGNGTPVLAYCADGRRNGDQVASDCGGRLCSACPVFLAASCTDGTQNQDETAIDCGGVCPACPVPTAATCTDGVQNQDETAIDCGGVCPACPVPTTATCTDGVQNQDETAIDCGGRLCSPCPVFPAASCTDGTQNQDETAIDCGGVCPACPVPTAATCTDGVQNQDETAIDCGGVCPACPTCSDQVQNQDEAGIDCGGAACPACIPSTCRQVVADSAADFSSIQGERGWYYGYYAEPRLGSGHFLQLPIYEHVAVLDEDVWRFGDQAWTHIGARVMHPNGRFTTGGKLALDQFAVRRWISNTTETLLIQGTIQTTGASSNGVLGRILVGDSEVWRQYAGPGPTGPIAFDTLASVQIGDAVNFVLEPFQSNDTSDATDFVVQLCR